MNKDTYYRVKSFYADIPEGTKGKFVKTWKEPNGRNTWITLFFGTNLSCQKLKKSFPANILEQIKNN